ncbi:MAG TPA: outer membrane protein assembly factor BamE [Thermoanaerobaculia bacterium]|jgi:hypothetical protein
MSGRQIRNALFLAIVAGIGYWIYTTRPTPSGIIDSITRPLFGSRAAVDTSERNRVRDEASTVVTDQSDTRVDTLRQGMSRDDVRELLGKPDTVENIEKDGVKQLRWTYREARRVVVFENYKVVSISVL